MGRNEVLGAGSGGRRSTLEREMAFSRRIPTNTTIRIKPNTWAVWRSMNAMIFIAQTNHINHYA
jgi:hypothetical protein